MARMGVLGLTPFLQRTCPEVIKELPDRLRGLAGKTIAIDGTLITQRLHFAPVPHTHRHVLGWYRIIKELREHDVHAICVFDEARNPAKAGEIERRKQVRLTNVARCHIEMERSKRLRELVGNLESLVSLDLAQRQKVVSSLQRIVLATPGASRPSFSLFPPSGTISSRGKPDLLKDSWEAEAIWDSPESNRPLSLLKDSGHQKNLSPSFSHSSQGQLDGGSGNLISDGLEVSQYPMVDSTVSAETVSNGIASLYFNYRRSLSRIKCLLAPPSCLSPDSDGTEDIASYVLSRNQQQLMVDEGHLWDSLLTCSSPEFTQSSLKSLADKSSAMTTSYQRRAQPATSQTYKESWEILLAMGVPCLTPTGEFEAEALASALVLNGFADYVASEDTDVLVYRAPLLRGLTSKYLPLVVMSGADVQDALELDLGRFVDFALLLGTDFSPRLRGVGPARALQFIRAHKSIERVIEVERNFPPQESREAYLAQIAVARAVFQTLPPVPDSKFLRPKEGDEAVVAEILQRYGLQRWLTGHEFYQFSTLEGNYFRDDPSI